MFERYTEPARRVVFFGRYEAVQAGSPTIETEHLLLGLLREEKALFHDLLPQVTYQSASEKIKAKGSDRAPTPTNVDLPLSNESKRVLAYAAEEAERLDHRHIGPEHLLLGLLRETKSVAARVLCELGVDLLSMRKSIAERPVPWIFRNAPQHLVAKAGTAPTVEIHGARYNLEYVHQAVIECTKHQWHWQRESWTPRDIVISPANGGVSFDIRLAQPPTNFRLVKNGWTQDQCVICHWSLKATDKPEHNTGYTNGRDWVCTECYEKFISRSNPFASNYPEIT